MRINFGGDLNLIEFINKNQTSVLLTLLQTNFLLYFRVSFVFLLCVLQNHII